VEETLEMSGDGSGAIEARGEIGADRGDRDDEYVIV